MRDEEEEEMRMIQQAIELSRLEEDQRKEKEQSEKNKVDAQIKKGIDALNDQEEQDKLQREKEEQAAKDAARAKAIADKAAKKKKKAQEQSLATPSTPSAP
jgi:hypothetical protein